MKYCGILPPRTQSQAHTHTQTDSWVSGSLSTGAEQTSVAGKAEEEEKG